MQSDRNHLSGRQIDEILRANSSCANLGTDPENHRAKHVDSSAQVHLDECPACRATVKARHAAVGPGDEWSLLNAAFGPASASGSEPDKVPGRAPVTGSASAQVRAHCPPRDVWASIAAGVVSEDAENYLNHATHCEHCGECLQQASQDFCDDLTPEEEAHIAALASSSPDWQMKLAAALHAAQPRTPAEPATGPSWFSADWFKAVVNYATPARVALAAAVFAAVVLGVQDYQLQSHLAEQSSHAAAELQQVEADADHQRAQIAQLTAQDVAPASASAPSMQPIRPESIAALTLESGLTRGSGETKRLSIPSGADSVKIVLHAPANASLAADQVREELMTVDRQPIWSQQLRPSPSETKSGNLSMLIPAYLLTPDDYLIVLTHESQSGSEEVATYSFRVPR